MSNTDHRAAAENALSRIPDCDPADEISYASEATAHALLAVEARLAEIAGEQHTANLIAAFQCGALDVAAEYKRVRDLIKALLGAIPHDGTNTDHERLRWLAEQARPHHRPDRTEP